MSVANPVRGRKIQVQVGMRISFRYKKMDGTIRDVENFEVDNIYKSQKGYRLIQGYREDGEGRTYRRNRMTNVKEVE